MDQTYFDEDRRRERAAIAGFVRAVRQGDVAAFYDAIDEVETTWGWRPAFRACARLDDAPDEIRAVFLRMWLTSGETLRSNIGDDLVLLPALRVLLPPYTGASVRLFRGDSFGNRLRRTYGMSWSSDRQAAAGFAQTRRDLYDGGTVLLETLAPPEAIISAPGLMLPDESLNEYVVDRRKLRAVHVLERFAYEPGTEPGS